MDCSWPNLVVSFALSYDLSQVKIKIEIDTAA